jgi:predicted cation transporter
MSVRQDSDAELLAFLRSAKEQNISDDFVVALLRQNGWPERRIYRAYSAFYADRLGAPLPKRYQAAENARDAFFYLLNFITLGFWTVALGQIFYRLIAYRLPDPAQSATYYGSLRDDIAWQLATVIVAFPTFVYVHSLIARELRKRSDLYESPVRRWLTYLTLVVAAIVVLTDAAWVIEALIRGELTLRFILDSLVLLVIGGGVFLYYLRTMEPPAAGE